MTSPDILRHAASQPGLWFHSIEIEPGVWTAGAKSRETMALELDRWQTPLDLSGQTVLDIGCADGGYAVAAIRRKAAAVTAIDEQRLRGLDLLLRSDAIPGLDFRQISLFSNAFLELPVHDYVIFAGVLYHVHDMMEAMKRVRAKTGVEALLETAFREIDGHAEPIASFHETDECGGDATNWWSPNLACIEAMARAVGFVPERLYLHGDDARAQTGRVAYRLIPVDRGCESPMIESAIGNSGQIEAMYRRIETLTKDLVALRRTCREAGLIPAKAST